MLFRSNMRRIRSGSTLKAKAVEGAFWTLFGYGGSQALRLVSNLVLARLLFPAAFGLMALVNVLMQGLQMFSDVGIAPSIIQNPRGETRSFLDTAWTVQVVRGGLLFLASCVLAYPAAQFFSHSDPSAWELLQLIPVVGLTALINGFQSTSLIVARRRLEFARLSVLEIVTFAIRVAVMISCAFVWPSVWALVAGGIAGSVFHTAMSYIWFADSRNRPRIDRLALKELVRYGKWVFLSTLVTFLASQLDRAVLGRLISLSDLGLYSLALVFTRLAMVVAERLSGAVLFPVLSQKANDRKVMMDICVRAREGVLWCAGAACCATAIGAPAFFGTLYDERYAKCGPIAQWLTLFIWTTILSSSVDHVPLAIGRPRTLFVSNVIKTLGMGLAVLGYQLGGLPGFIVSLAAMTGLAHVYVVWTLPSHRTHLNVQTARFTLGFGAYALVGVLVTDWAGAEELLLRVVVTVGVLVPPAVLTAIVLRRLVRQPSRRR